MACFWWYTASAVRVLGFLRHMPPIPRVSHILNVAWFFFLRFFTHLGIPLPDTVTFCELCCP